MAGDTGEHSGGCLCGAVRFSVSGPLRDVICCHCRSCRRQSGHFWAASSAPRAAFRIVGEAAITWYSATPAARRGFCGTCGSLLFWEPTGEDRLSVSPGALDRDTGLVTAKHIFVAEKGGYYAIPDDAPQFARDN